MPAHKNIDTICIAPDTAIADTLRVLARNKPQKSGIPGGIALVVDDSRTLLGLVTSGDLLRAVAKGTPLARPVRSIMNKDPFVIVGRQPAAEVVRLAVQKTREEGWHKDRLEKIVIVDAKRKVLDLVDLYDLWQGSDIRLRRIAVVGLGYVGLTLGLTLADLGFEVRGFDLNEKVRAMVSRKKAPFFELGLPELLTTHVGKRFAAVGTLTGNECEAYFIAVGTPLNAAKKPDLGHLRAAAQSVGKVLKQGDVVILRSTVPLGTTRTVVVPILEKASGLTAGEDFYVAFAPERTVEGKALEELRTLPQVIGGINRASANVAADIFNLMTRTIHLVDTLEEAEVIKLINNTYRDVSFAFANEVALICQRWGIDTNKVITAANAGYERSRVPKPSPGVGGYCLDKDPYIFIEGGKAKQYESALFKEARAVNTAILQVVVADAVAHLRAAGKKNPKVFVLGFAFKGKPATSDLRGSSTLILVEGLRKAGYKNIHGFDPVVGAAELRKLRVRPVADPKEGFKAADLVIIMNNHAYFEQPDMVRHLRHAAKGALFFDTWALHNPEEVAKISNIKYRRL